MASSRMILGMASILLSLGMVSSVMSLSNAEGMEEAICKASQSYTSSCRQNRRGSSDLPRMASLAVTKPAAPAPITAWCKPRGCPEC